MTTQLAKCKNCGREIEYNDGGPWCHTSPVQIFCVNDDVSTDMAAPEEQDAFKATPVSATSYFPTADGGGVLTLDGKRYVLSNAQANSLLAGLLVTATIKIEPDADYEEA